MFEKEAEEYIEANNLEWELECHRTSPIGEVKQAFQEGAEFGYNKGNEWHYVKNGDLPKHDNYVLVSDGKDWAKGFYKNTMWNVISLVGYQHLNVVAWKEIVFPELKEVNKK